MHELDHAPLSYCPFIIADDGSYPREANQYLRERALAEWVPQLGQSGEVKYRVRVHTKRSSETMARRLIEFLRWCLRESKDWRSVTYLEDLLSEWQPSLLLGTRSTSGKKLANSTVTGLISEAILFLTWAAVREYRGPFKVILNVAAVNKSKGDRTYGHKKSIVETRLGSLSPAPQLMKLPEDSQISQWLREVELLRGPVKRLACETICRTGLRITECAQLLVTDFPNKTNGSWPRDVIENESVRVLIHRGNKGPKIHAGSLESTKPRYVYFPIDLADRIANYICEGRPTLIMRAINSIKDKHERQIRSRSVKPTRLWIGEKSGLPFTSGMLYKSWTSVPGCPADWHPHAGREFFAVDTVVTYMRDLLATKSIIRISGVNQLAWLDGLMSGQIRIILSPLLGHVSEDTSRKYLKAGKHRLVEIFGHPALIWDEICDGNDQNGR